MLFNLLDRGHTTKLIEGVLVICDVHDAVGVSCQGGADPMHHHCLSAPLDADPDLQGHELATGLPADLLMRTHCCNAVPDLANGNGPVAALVFLEDKEQRVEDPAARELT